MNQSDKSSEQESVYGTDDYRREQQASEGSNGCPQYEEIEEYARFLGMNPEDSIDRNLLWIAKNGLMEPVPQPW